MSTPAIATPKVIEKKCNKWRINHQRYDALGIKQGDLLHIDEADWCQNGAWVVVAFDGKYYIRELQIMTQTIRLLPITGDLQAIDWPIHLPVPVVGRIIRIEREMPIAQKLD